MEALFERAMAAVEYVRAQGGVTPRVGIVLGSGLGEFADAVEGAVRIAYGAIPGFSRSTVEGHSGTLVLGTVAGVPVAVMQGRVHAYEGYTMGEVTFPVRVLGLLGCETLVVTNAAGGIDPGYGAGELVLIADHINLTGMNAAVGPNEERFAVAPGAGLRFFDMTTAYDAGLREVAKVVAAEQGIRLPEGIYLGVIGPSYETAAEIRAFRTLGATLVGMSTVHEVIVARHMGMRVLGISLVTNAAAGVSAEVIHHEEVMDVGRQVAGRFAALVTGVVGRL